VRANLAAVRALHALEAEDRPATPDEQAVLARLVRLEARGAGVFDERDERFAEARAELRGRARRGRRVAAGAASRNTLNAHYTDAAYVQAVWAGLQRARLRGWAGAGAGLRGGSVHRLCSPGRGDDRGGAGPDHGGKSAGHCTPAALFWPRASLIPVPPKPSSTPR